MKLANRDRYRRRFLRIWHERNANLHGWSLRMLMQGGPRWHT